MKIFTEIIKTRENDLPLPAIYAIKKIVSDLFIEVSVYFINLSYSNKTIQLIWIVGLLSFCTAYVLYRM